MRTLRDMPEKPLYEVLVEIGFDADVLQIARLDVKGRTVWKTKRIANQHATDFTTLHGKTAYVSEC